MRRGGGARVGGGAGRFPGFSCLRRDGASASCSFLFPFFFCFRFAARLPRPHGIKSVRFFRFGRFGSHGPAVPSWRGRRL